MQEPKVVSHIKALPDVRNVVPLRPKPWFLTLYYHVILGVYGTRRFPDDGTSYHGVSRHTQRSQVHAIAFTASP